MFRLASRRTTKLATVPAIIVASCVILSACYRPQVYSAPPAPITVARIDTVIINTPASPPVLQQGEPKDGHPRPRPRPAGNDYDLERMRHELQAARAALIRQQQSIRYAADSVIPTLAVADVQFDVPKRMSVTATYTVSLTIHPELMDAEADLPADDRTKVLRPHVRIAPQMEAVLTGEGFTISPAGSQKQAVTTTDASVWEWQVTARNPGKKSLHAELFLLLPVSGETTARRISSFQQTVEIPVTFRYVLASVLDQWKWLWTAIIIPAAAWLYRKLQKSKGQVAS